MGLQEPYVKVIRDFGDVVAPSDHNKQEEQLEALTTRVNRRWTDDTRPTPGSDDLYPLGFNEDSGVYEYWNGGEWVQVGGGGGDSWYAGTFVQEDPPTVEQITAGKWGYWYKESTTQMCQVKNHEGILFAVELGQL